jgi:hypothetical protein
MRRFIPPRRGDSEQKWFYCHDCGVAKTDASTGEGRLWPLSHIVNDNGVYRCIEHFNARAKYLIDGQELNLDDYPDTEM